MNRFVSTLGGIEPVDFETAVTRGFAADGGLFVPKDIPTVTPDRLEQWSSLSFAELAYEILALFIEDDDIPAKDLKSLVEDSYSSFNHPEITPVVPIGKRNDRFVLELFHGPTLSFKDMAMGFLINCLDYFLAKRSGHMSLLVATTGDTGPAAAYASVGKKTLDCWVMYPQGFISEEQERQMTTLETDNVHAVGVSDCLDGGDDLDLVVAKMFADDDLRKRLHLSSVNSINWCRVMVQAVHYFYAYFRVVERPGEKITFAVPTGAFGNLFGGYLARKMGLPVETLICANNTNAASHNLFKQGILAKSDLQQTVSSAIDIVVPYNLWRYLYFTAGADSTRIQRWMSDFSANGSVRLDPTYFKSAKDGFISSAVSDELTLSMIKEVYQKQGYLLDPHAAVAVAAADAVRSDLNPDTKIVCLATAHPAKFPEVTLRALGLNELPSAGKHPSIEAARELCQQARRCHYEHLFPALVRSISIVTERCCGEEISR